MQRQLYLSAALALLFTLLLVTYMAGEPSRQVAAAKRQQAQMVAGGERLYATYCTQCHGPTGQGAIGPNLTRFGAGGAEPEEQASTAELLREAIRSGRAGTVVPTLLKDAEGNLVSRTAMPAWSQEKGGALTMQQIEDLVAFIQYGDWAQVLPMTPAPKLDGSPPTNSALPKAAQQSALELMRVKGCLACHTLGGLGGTVGPDLTYVGQRWDSPYLQRWLKGPRAVDRSNYVWSSGQRIPLGPPFMPAIPLSEEELKAIVDYLASLK